MNARKSLVRVLFLGLLATGALILAFEPKTTGAIVADQLFGVDQTALYGNKYYIEWNYAYFKLDNPNKRIALRFTALNSKTLSAVHVFSTYPPKGAPTVTLQLQTDDGSSSHFPSGIVLTETTITSFPGNFRWIRVSVPQVNVVEGSIYHIVMFSQNSDANNNWDYRITKPLNEFWINDIPNLRGVTTSTQPVPSWIDQFGEPIYVLEYTDAKREGNPFSGSYRRPIWGGWKQGENVVIQNDMRISAISMRASKQGSPADNVYIVFTTAPDPERDGEILVRGIAATPSQVAVFPKFDWVTYTLPSPLTLSPARYRIYLESPGSTETNSYFQDQDIATPGYEELTYGPNGTASMNCYVQQTPEGASTRYWGRERYVDHAFTLEIAGLPKVWEKPFTIAAQSNQITSDIAVSGVKEVNFSQNITVTIRNGKDTATSGTITVEVFLGSTLKATLESELAITISAGSAWAKTYAYTPTEIGEFKVKATFLES